MDECTLPRHRRALSIAVEAEFTASKLRGLAWLISGWLEFLNTTHVGGEIHDQVGIFLSDAINHLADGLDPRHEPGDDDPAATTSTANGKGLSIVRPEPVA
jgi:hypothetical protein